MAKRQVLSVQGRDITLLQHNENDYINLSDIASEFGGNDQIKNWIRTRRTVEFLGVWEGMNNPDFNVVEFHHVKNESGSEKFIMSPTQWAERTSAIGIMAKSGRYGGGTFAHKDIAFEFCSWLSPEFKLYLILEFQRLKEAEQKAIDPEWTVRRVLAKVNYRFQTDAVRDHLLPTLNLAQQKERYEYAEEADVLNLAVFGQTAKDWRETNPTLALQGKNLRDVAGLDELTVIANLESINAMLLKDNHPRAGRLKYLTEVATQQLEALRKVNIMRSITATQKSQRIAAPKPDKSIGQPDSAANALPAPLPNKRKKPSKGDK